MTPRPSPISVTRASRRLHVDEGGQISALGVLAAAVFACLLLLVINTGYATSGKIQMQNAADATALSGATWMARGLNIISLNNVTQTQLLAIILILRALDDAIPPAIRTLQAELAACVWSIVCNATPLPEILSAQIYVLQALVQPVVSETRNTMAGSSGDPKSGLLWTAMQLLSKMSSAVAVTFPVIGELESIRIARADGADVGVLVPARWTVDGWPSLPVHKGALSPDLCERTRNGPLGEYSGYVKVALLPFANSLIHVYFYGFRAMHYASVCGGSGSAPSEPERVGSLAECEARGGGTAVWEQTTYETVLFDTRQSSISISGKDDPRLDGPPQYTPPLQTDCSWRPAGRSLGEGRYQRLEETPVKVGEDDHGNPIWNYRYRVYEYTFLAASVGGDEEVPAATEAAPSSDDDPYPLLIGGDRNSTREQAQRELRYLAVTYRSRQVAVAPDFFVSPYGSHRLAYGQARVYNPTAFDTFTQDWRVTLDRTSMIEDGTLVSGLFNSNLAGHIPADTSPGVFGRITGFFGGLSGAVLGFLNNH